MKLSLENYIFPVCVKKFDSLKWFNIQAYEKGSNLISDIKPAWRRGSAQGS